MKKLFTTTLVALLVSATAMADHLSNRLTFSARLTPYPGLTVNTNGVAAFMLNSTMDTMYFTITASNLSSALTGFHIHNKRTGGNVIVDFDGKIEGTTVRSFMTGNDLKMYLPDFFTQNLYVAVHTTNNPAVEALGFIKLETDFNYKVNLAGIGSAEGLGSVNFSLSGDSLMLSLVAHNLSSKITAAHLHYGKAMQNGPVGIDLSNTIRMDSMSLMGKQAITDWTTLWTALMNDSVYLALHTENNPGGEARGQLMGSSQLTFDATINQKQLIDAGVTPAKLSMGFGTANLRLNTSFDSLWYEIAFNQTTSPVVAAHFHNAEPTGNGAVVKEFMVMGNKIMGYWTASDTTNPLTPAMVGQLLYGNIYIVLHTDSNPGGELRGNVFRLAREGFIAELDAKQASTTSMANGTAVVSYNRERTNLHYMVACNNLSGPITSAHLHKAIKGENGGVVYDLGNTTINGFYGYWNTFSNAQSLPLRRGDSIYVNIHTNMFANGEIRGQLMRDYKISKASQTTGLTNVASAISVGVYPNPSSNFITLELPANLATAAALKVTILDINLKPIEVTAQANQAIDISGLTNGLYLVKFESNGQTFLGKFIKY